MEVIISRRMKNFRNFQEQINGAEGKGKRKRKGEMLLEKPLESSSICDIPRQNRVREPVLQWQGIPAMHIHTALHAHSIHTNFPAQRKE